MTDNKKIKVSCPVCGATNAFPAEGSGKKVVCGRCRTVLQEPGTVLEPPPDQFATLFLKAGLPLLVDFYSPTCAPCHVMQPAVDNLAKRRAGELMVVKVNVDQHPELAARFGVQAVPTFLVLFKGNIRGQTSGAVSETDFSLWVASLV